MAMDKDMIFLDIGGGMSTEKPLLGLEDLGKEDDG